MLTSDSDTESDDLSKYFSTLVPPRYTKGKCVEEETRSQSARGWKEDLGNFVILSLHLLCLINFQYFHFNFKFDLSIKSLFKSDLYGNSRCAN